MIINIKVPSPGESITEVELVRWLVENNEIVEKNKEIAEIDSDKATLTITAEESGKIEFLSQEGDKVNVGSVICTINTDFEFVRNEGSIPVETSTSSEQLESTKSNKKELDTFSISITPLAKNILSDSDLNPKVFSNRNEKITKKIVLEEINHNSKPSNDRPVEIVKMSSLRKKLAERLVAVKNQTAMLTTFNEVDMTEIMKLRAQYKEAFKEKHGSHLGFISFFVNAVVQGFQDFPQINASIDGEFFNYYKYADVGIAVSTAKGLMVPVIKNANELGLKDIEIKLAELAVKARDNKITIEELSGGTFTITNGGVFGSLMSTPILNPPQSAILGMHKIMDRAIVVNGKIEIRPMMYIALSYDHRIIDGKESVGFVVKVKEILESPIDKIFGGEENIKSALGL
jgi:2-oxoglutarate dehydrogenase E2 component (dihydrolipoamide succinyltransferase)